MKLFRCSVISHHGLVPAFMISLLFIAPLTYAEIIDSTDAIKKAAHQRVLSQQILSSYYQIGKQINLSKSKKQLADSIVLFDTQLRELNAYAQTTKLISLQRDLNVDLDGDLKKVSRLWNPIKKTVSTEVEKSRAEMLRAFSESLLSASQQVFLDIQKLSGDKSGRLLDISKQMSMLSQRLSSLYILKSWGFNNAVYDNDYAGAIREYRLLMNELMAAPNNTKEIENRLWEIEKYFKMFEKSNLQAVNIPSVMRRSAVKMLTIMNNVTALYQIEAKK